MSEPTQDAVVPEQDVPGDGIQPDVTQPVAQTTERTFTQEEVNRMMGDRAKRAGAQQVKAMLDDFGFDSADALKTTLEEAAKFRKERMSELERAQNAAKEANEAKVIAEAERDNAIRSAKTTLIRSAFVAAAAALNVAHPSDAYALADLAQVEVDENNSVTGVDAQVKALVDAGRLPLKGLPQGPATDAGAGAGVRPTITYPQLTPEEVTVAQKMGVTAEKYQQQKAAIANRK